MSSSRDRKIVIGGAGAFLSDSITAFPQLLKLPKLDYLIADYLAEVTMPILALKRAHKPGEGYAREFTEWEWRDNLREILRRRVKVVTNAGGLNPRACRERMLEIAAELGFSPRIAIVEGDDVRPLLPGLQAERLQDMITGNEAFPDPQEVLCANAYLGAVPIARALEEGADFVITGRVVDSALVLGPLIKEFGWSLDDYDRLAAGTLAGHVIECGAQTTGGTFTDWEDVPDWAHIGYPFIECASDGTFVVGKPEGTGGIVTVGSVSEQVLYEVGDPQAYIVPDVVCDFSQVRVEQVGPDRVRVSNAIGRPPTDKFKVSISYQDGYRYVGLWPVLGIDAARKGERQALALVQRVEELLRDRNIGPFRAMRIEALGAEASYGSHSRARASREVVMRVGVEHEDRDALKLFAREFHSPAVSMSVGTTAILGVRSQIEPVIRIFSCLVPRARITPRLSYGELEQELPDARPRAAFAPDMVVRPSIEAAPAEASDEEAPVRLLDLAWARSGDKGDSFSIAVLARRAEYLPYIRRQLTEKAVSDFFEHEFDGSDKARVTRFEAPGVNGLNFLLVGALGGGQLSSLRIDSLAKAKAQQLLDFPLQVPADLIASIEV